MQEQPDQTIDSQYDIVKHFQTNFKKVKELVQISQSILLIIRHDYSYLVIQLPKIDIIARGKLPKQSQNFTAISFQEIIFIRNNKLHVLQWKSEKISLLAEINQSQVYHERFEYKLRVNGEGEMRVLMWKNSLLMNNTDQIQSEINVYRLYRHNKIGNDDLQSGIESPLKTQKLKHYRLTLNSFYSVQFCNHEPVVIRKKGYRIDIKFLQSNVIHQINSIYKVLLIQTRVEKTENEESGQEMVLVFRRENYAENELLRIRATKSKYSRQYSNQEDNPNHIYIFSDSLKYPLLNHRSFDKEYYEDMKNFNRRNKNKQVSILEIEKLEENEEGKGFEFVIKVQLSLKLKYMFLIHHLNLGRETWSKIRQLITDLFFAKVSESIEGNLEEEGPKQLSQKYKDEHEYEISQNLASMILSLL